MKVNRKELLKCLEMVEAGISQQNEIVQSSCYVFQDGKVWTFNDEMACSTDLPSELSELECIVPSNEFRGLLSKLDEDVVGIDLKEGQLILKTKRRRAGIRAESELMLPISEVKLPDEGPSKRSVRWQSIPDGFDKAVETVCQVAGKDKDAMLLTCLHIRSKGIEACDNYQAIRYSIKTGLDDSVLVKRDSLTKVSALKMEEWSIADAWVHFRNSSSLVVSCRRVNEKYPDLGPLFEVQGVMAPLPEDLVDAVAMAETIFEEKSDLDGMVVSLREGQLSLKAEGLKGWYEERQKSEYKGKPLQFKIAPRLLREVLKRTEECTIGSEKLKVKGDRYVYVSCLVVEG